MTTYPITGSRHERLLVWLTFNGLQLRKRKGTYELRVLRGRTRQLRLWLHDTGTVAWFSGDRATKRSPRVDKLMQAWNQAEHYLPGAWQRRGADTTLQEWLADKPDHEVQGMVDYYAANPIGLENIGLERVTLDWNGKPGKAGRVVERRFTAIRDLGDLVDALARRAEYSAELVRRNLHFENAVSVEVKISLPTGQLELFA